MAARIPEPHLGAWRALLNAHAALVAAVEDELAAAGLPPLSWYDVLWGVRRAPGRRIRMAELAENTTISRGGLTKLVDRLEDAGLLSREPVVEDGRGLYAVLTDDGERMLRRMWPVYARVLQRSFVDVVPRGQAAAIEAGLRSAADSARRGEAIEAG